MGRVTESAPITIGNLKTGYGQTGTKTLRNFLPGAGIVNTNTATIGGFLPTSGTINLLDFRGATDLNVTFAGSNTGFIVNSQDVREYRTSGVDAYAISTVTVSNNGRLQLSADGNQEASTTAGGVVGVYTTTVPNSWLQQQAGTCSTSITGLYEVKFQKTGGDSIFTSNNTWLACSTSRTQIATALSYAGSGVADSSSIKGRIAFRKVGTTTELANVYIELFALAYAVSESCPICCFTPDTLITMSDMTTKKIVDIEVGDSILVYNSITAVNESQLVTGVITRIERAMYKITFSDESTIEASDDHPLYVFGKGYSAINPVGVYKDLETVEILEIGDSVQDQTGNSREIIDISPFDYPHTVYTLENSRFYANGLLVY